MIIKISSMAISQSQTWLEVEPSEEYFVYNEKYMRSELM